MSRRHHLAALLLSSGLLVSAQAAAANRLLAVLPLDTRMTQNEMTDAARASLEEMIRDQAVNLLAPSGWTVLTGETTLQILLDNGIDPAKCADQTCHLSIAREINAQKFVSGVVQFAEGEFTASIRLIDTKSGRIVSTERLNGKSTKAMREDFGPKAQSFFARGGLIDEVPVAADPERAKDSEGMVKIVSNPPGATVVIDGVVMGRTPWRKPMAAGTYYVGLELEGYQPIAKSVTVDVSKEATVFELMQSERGVIHVTATGFINVATTPNNASVTIDGQFAGTGQQGPFSAGRHIIRVEAPGYLPREKAITLQNGETVTSMIVLSPIAGSLMVSANIETECDVQDKRLRVMPSNAETVTLSSGTSRIVCRAPGYEDAVRNVMVEAGEMLFVHMCLVPKAQSFISNPQNGRVRGVEPVPGLYIEKSRPRVLQIDPIESRQNGEQGTLEIQTRPSARPARPQYDTQPMVTSTPKARELDFVWFGGGQSRCDPDDEDCEDTAPAARPFWLTKNTITADEYGRCVRAGACAEPRRGGRCTWGTGRFDQAVNCVDWQQAKQFCEWSGARLPTIEEWELAALGEKPKVDSRIADPAEFRSRSGDDDSIDDEMSMDALDRDGRAMAKTARATLSKAAQKVLIKMVPQVWEWTATSSGSKKVLTGLTQTNSPWPSPSRRYSSMTFTDDAVGFRCAK